MIGRIFASEIWGAYYWEGLVFLVGGGGRGGGAYYQNFTAFEKVHAEKFSNMYFNL